MKGLKCYTRLLSVFICSLLAVCLLISSPAKAYNFNYDGTVHYLNYQMSYLKTDDGQRGAGVNGDNIYFTDLTVGYSAREMQIYFQTPITTEPTLASFNITYSVGASQTLWYYGIQWREAVTLSDSCSNTTSGAVTNPAQIQQTTTCSYLILINEPNLVALHSMPNAEIFYYLNQTGGDTGRITVTPFVTRGINNNGLSADDRAWLLNNMPTSASPAQIESSVESALESQAESERDELESSQDDAESQADSSASQSESQGQSFVQIASGFVNGLKNVQPSNCVIDVDLSLYHGGTHNYVDLCPQPKNSTIATILNTVGGIVFGVWIIRVVVEIIELMLLVYREYQE